jgi:hypothetical protein
MKKKIFKKPYIVKIALLIFLQATWVDSIAYSQCLVERDSVTEVLDLWLTKTEELVVPVAEAMPEDKFNFAPPISYGDFKGVKTFAEQIKHFSATQYQLAAAILGEKAPHGEKNEKAPDYLKTRKEILEYLKESFAYLHRAVATINKDNMVKPLATPFKGSPSGFVIDAILHTANHYGQMVEYLRMNNIIPPDSRKK